jgi:hypothetical protein
LPLMAPSLSCRVGIIGVLIVNCLSGGLSIPTPNFKLNDFSIEFDKVTVVKDGTLILNNLW